MHYLDDKIVNQTHEARELRTKQYDRSRKRSNDCRITALLHDRINHRDGKTAHDSGESTHSNKRNVIYRVTITDIVELEMSIEAYKPASQTKQHLGKGRVNIKVILAQDIEWREFSKMDFIEAAFENVHMREDRAHKRELTQPGLDDWFYRTEVRKLEQSE